MRTRVERRTRTVAYSPVPGAPTENITQEYDAVVPVAPFDLDRALYRFGVGSVALIVGGSMAWSTVSIGSLLKTVAPEWVSFTVAGAFDLAWVVCLVFEWLNRRDPDRARLPFILGWASLALSMAAIVAHGGMLDSTGVKWGWAVGSVGAFVSAIAKTLWLVVMHHHSVELAPEQREWLDKRRSAVQTQLIMATEEVALQRVEDAALATRLSLAESRNGVASHVVQRVASPATQPETVSHTVAVPATQPSLPSRPRPVSRPAGATAVPRPTPPVIDPAELAGRTLMTTAEVAEYTGATESTVRGWKGRGKLVPAVQNGSTPLYDKADVDAMRVKRANR
jgi:hypothetical protein